MNDLDKIVDEIYNKTFGIIDNASRIEQIKTYIELYVKITGSDRQKD